MDLVQHTETPHPPGSTTLVIIFIHFFPFSIFVISSLSNHVSCNKYPIIIVFPIHDFSDFMSGIFSIVTGDDIIHDSSILDKSLLHNYYAQNVLHSEYFSLHLYILQVEL